MSPHVGAATHPAGHRDRGRTQGHDAGGGRSRVPGPQLRRSFPPYPGIPIKKSPTITAERALHLSFLITDYWATARKVIQSDLKMSDVLLPAGRTPSRRSASAPPSRRRSSSSRRSVSRDRCRWGGHALPGAELRAQEGGSGRGEEGGSQGVTSIPFIPPHSKLSPYGQQLRLCLELQEQCLLLDVPSPSTHSLKPSPPAHP